MIKLFTHTDLDGVGCAILGRYMFGEAIDIEYCDYENVNEKVNEFIDTQNIREYATIFITDISVDDQIAEKINGFENFVLLDHHPTAERLNKYEWANVYRTKGGVPTCGTELFFDWLIKHSDSEHILDKYSLKKFIEIVRDYDTWRWVSLGEKGKISKEYNDLFGIYGRDRFIEKCFTDLQNNRIANFNMLDLAALEQRQNEIDRYVEQKEKTMIQLEVDGKNCGVVYADRFVSELGNRLCDMHPEIDVAVMINMDGSISYRTSKSDVDVSKLASKFGGGGHVKAAGSRFNDFKRIAVSKFLLQL